MKLPLIPCLAVVVAVFGTACDKPVAKVPATPKPEPPPVVKVAPVLTRPYEEGYASGFVVGKAEGKPKATPPTEQEVDIRSVEAAGTHEDRGLKWQRGWSAGYTDGFRQISEGRK